MKLKKLRSAVLRQIVAASDAEAAATTAESSSVQRVQGLGPVLKAALPSALLLESGSEFEVR